MSLSDLYARLAPSFSGYAQKNLPTAVRYLAEALQCSDPQHCPLDRYHRPLPSLYRLVETHLLAKGKSKDTIRNTKNNLSRLFRLAEEQHLLSLTPQPLTPRYPLKNKPARPGGAHLRRNGTYLPYTQWPAALQDAFTAYAAWATDPVVPGRDASRQKRFSTINGGYRRSFEAYFGFLHHIQQRPTLTFEQLFDLPLVTAFVYWHVKDIHQRPTVTIHNFLTNLIALTHEKDYRPLPALRAQLGALKKTLAKPSPVYNKEDAWVPIATLRAIGHSLWPQQPPQPLPHETHHSDHKAAWRAGLSLMLQLWTYIPYRQRNICEMQFEDNLKQDAHGHWFITFRGEQLKIARRRGQPNIFKLSFPPTLVPLLEDYQKIWRPLLLTQASQPSAHVFLTSRGTPYQQQTLTATTHRIVYSHTGKYWHPHNIRTVWATEWIENGGDLLDAARLLNDKLETVVNTYAHLRDQIMAEEVYKTLDQRYGWRE
jgi:Phage integrase family